MVDVGVIIMIGNMLGILAGLFVGAKIGQYVEREKWNALMKSLGIDPIKKG